MISTLFKILFIIGFIYVLYNLVRMFFGLGSTLKERHRREEQLRQEGPRSGRMKRGKDREVIELEKDQYRVE